MLLAHSIWERYDSLPAACSAQTKVDASRKIPVKKSVSEQFDSIDVCDTDAAQTAAIDVEGTSTSDPLITILPVVTKIDDIAIADVVSINRVLSGTHMVLSTSEVGNIAAAEVHNHQALSGTHVALSMSGKALQVSVPAHQASTEPFSTQLLFCRLIFISV